MVKEPKKSTEHEKAKNNAKATRKRSRNKGFVDGYAFGSEKNKRCYFAELNKCSEENKENDETSVWHHVDDTKESEDHSIGRMISDGVGIIQLKAELEKCHLAHKSCHDAHHGR